MKLNTFVYIITHSPNKCGFIMHQLLHSNHLLTKNDFINIYLVLIIKCKKKKLLIFIAINCFYFLVSQGNVEIHSTLPSDNPGLCKV